MIVKHSCRSNECTLERKDPEITLHESSIVLKLYTTLITVP